MRISPVVLANSHNLASKKHNPSFGLIEKENRDKIIAAIPEKDEELREMAIFNMDYNKGTIVKWGGEGHPRGLFYADLIPEHVEKSPAKYLYNDTFFKKSVNHLEEYENFEWFTGTLDSANIEEIKAEKGIKDKPAPSRDTEPYNYMEDYFKWSLGDH